MKFSINNRLKILLILSLVAGLLLSLKLLVNVPFQIIASDPKNNQDQVDTQRTVKLISNKKLTLNELIIIPSPGFIFETKIIGKSLEIIPQQLLEPETTYKIELKNKKYPKFYFILSFKTSVSGIPSPIPTYFTDEQTKKFYEELDKKTYEAMPLFDYVPYKTNDFIIDYIRPLVLQIRLKKDTSAVRQEALDWIKSKGADKTHQVEWKAVE